MEYVPGKSIIHYCDEHKMPPRARLDLFIKVCDGVQHAHQKAIIHRDIKPSNILVSDLDGMPRPRIIDFGVAKAMSQHLTADTMHTQAGALIGTPGYISPEQADPNSAGVDTRSDVYSLGVVLYELLVGAQPLDFAKLPFDQFLRRLREDDVPKPSTKLRTLGERSSTTAQNRGIDVGALARELRGDLDTIVLKALEKDPSRRYATPSELVADIGRHLRSEPVLARTGTAGYRARKYVRRHRIGVTLAAAAVLLVIAVSVAQAFELRRIRRERDRANRIATFVTQMFKVSDPSEARGATVTAREILDRAAKDIDTGLSKDPELQAQMMATIGNVYQGLGLYTRATPLLERSVDLDRRVLGPANPETLLSQAKLGWTLQQQGRYPEAETWLRRALEAQRRSLGKEHPDTLKTLGDLAWTMGQAGRYIEAEELGREASRAMARVLGPENPDTLKTLANLAWSLEEQGRYAEAETLQRQTLEIQRRVLGDQHPDTLAASNNLAGTLLQENKLPEAEQMYRHTVDLSKRVLGPEHPDTLTPTSNLAIVLMNEGRFADAETLQREVVNVQRRVLGPEHPQTLKITGQLAESVEGQGRYTDAERLDRQVLETERRVLGAEHPLTLESLYRLANVIADQHRNAEAERVYLETLGLQRKVLGANHPFTANTIFSLGLLASAQGRRDEAFSRLRQALDHGLVASQALGIETNDNLKPLRRDQRFSELVAYARQKAGQTPH
jgi:non-specific serine/threonine protein kinase/serine/threonine-protein kinase